MTAAAASPLAGAGTSALTVVGPEGRATEIPALGAGVAPLAKGGSTAPGRLGGACAWGVVALAGADSKTEKSAAPQASSPAGVAAGGAASTTVLVCKPDAVVTGAPRGGLSADSGWMG